MITKTKKQLESDYNEKMKSLKDEYTSDTDKMEWKEFIYKIYRIGIADGIDIRRGSEDRFFGNKEARAKWEEKWVEEWFLELNSELQKAADSARVKVVEEVQRDITNLGTKFEIAYMMDENEDQNEWYKNLGYVVRNKISNILESLTDTNTKEGK